jgi:hypothetical protein
VMMLMEAKEQPRVTPVAFPPPIFAGLLCFMYFIFRGCLFVILPMGSYLKMILGQDGGVGIETEAKGATRLPWAPMAWPKGLPCHGPHQAPRWPPQALLLILWLLLKNDVAKSLGPFVVRKVLET